MSWFFYQLAAWPEASHSVSPGSGFLICKTRGSRETSTGTLLVLNWLVHSPVVWPGASSFLPSVSCTELVPKTQHRHRPQLSPDSSQDRTVCWSQRPGRRCSQLTEPQFQSHVVKKGWRTRGTNAVPSRSFFHFSAWNLLLSVLWRCSKRLQLQTIPSRASRSGSPATESGYDDQPHILSSSAFQLQNNFSTVVLQLRLVTKRQKT